MPEHSLIPERYHILSGSALKVLAVLFMVIDHIGAFVLRYMPVGSNIILHLPGHPITLYYMTRLIGRLAFPIFAFLLVEGFLHTRDRKKYGLRLGLFALISEIPWDLLVFGELSFRGQNVFFTLFLGYLALCAVERFMTDETGSGRWQYAAILLVLLLAAFYGHVDYSVSGLVLILMMYWLRAWPLFRSILGCCILASRWRAGLSAIPIALYNGKRGFIQSKGVKIAFYAIYPLNLLLFYWIHTGLQ